MRKEFEKESVQFSHSVLSDSLWPHGLQHARKDWGQEEKGTTGDEMVGWHHQLDGHEFGQALGVGDGHAGKTGVL